MDYLPLFFRLKAQPVLVVGGGEIAARKVALLCRAGASVRIVSPAFAAETLALVEEFGLETVPRDYETGDISGNRLVVSATDDESVNARIRKAVRARGHFPNEQAALKCVYMALMSLDPTGNGRRRWTMRWKAPLNAFQIAFEGRLTPANL